MGSNQRYGHLPTRSEVEEAFKPALEPLSRYKWKQAFIMSKKMNLVILRVGRIGEGICVLRAIGEGKLMVADKKSPAGGGYYGDMVEADLTELEGKSPQEILDLLDRKYDQILAKSRER